MLLEHPCSLSSGLPPQSPTGGHQGKENDKTTATIARKQSNPEPAMAARLGLPGKRGDGSGRGQLRREEKNQKRPGITSTPEKTTAACNTPPNSQESRRTSTSPTG